MRVPHLVIGADLMVVYTVAYPKVEMLVVWTFSGSALTVARLRVPQLSGWIAVVNRVDALAKAVHVVPVETLGTVVEGRTLAKARAVVKNKPLRALSNADTSVHSSVPNLICLAPLWNRLAHTIAMVEEIPEEPKFFLLKTRVFTVLLRAWLGVQQVGNACLHVRSVKLGKQGVGWGQG